MRQPHGRRLCPRKRERERDVQRDVSSYARSCHPTAAPPLSRLAESRFIFATNCGTAAVTRVRPATDGNYARVSPSIARDETRTGKRDPEIARPTRFSRGGRFSSAKTARTSGRSRSGDHFTSRFPPSRTTLNLTCRRVLSIRHQGMRATSPHPLLPSLTLRWFIHNVRLIAPHRAAQDVL